MEQDLKNEIKEYIILAAQGGRAETSGLVMDILRKLDESIEASVKKHINKDTTETLANALRDVFGENQASGRFVDVSRIPLICKSIIDMHENIKQIQDNLTWVVRLIIGAVIMALLGLVLIK